MISTHPKVGMAVLVGIRVKAKVWALARCGAHSFLAVRAVCRIVAPLTYIRRISRAAA